LVVTPHSCSSVRWASVALVLCPLAAGAQEDPTQAHLAAANAAMEAEARGDHEGVLRACGAAIALLPEGPRAPRCRGRVARLEARRDADGGFTSLRGLEAALATRDPTAARASVLAVLGREQVPPAVHAEATAWLAADDLRRGDPGACLDHTELLYASRADLDELVRAEVITLRAQALARLGREQDARSTLEELRVAAPAPRPTVVDEELATQAAARWRWGAWAALGAFAAAALVRAPRVRPAGPPWGLVPLALTAAGAWAVAELFADGDGRPVLPLLGALTAVHLLAWRAAAGAGRGGAALSALAFGASLAAAWLVLDALDVTIGAAS
jgi:hypothetical protein